MKKLLAMSFAVGAMTLVGTMAEAAPLTGTATAPELDASLVTPIVRIVCIRDDRGWHHMRGQRRVICRPLRPSGNYWGWRREGNRSGWYHRRDKRWND